MRKREASLSNKKIKGAGAQNVGGGSALTMIVLSIVSYLGAMRSAAFRRLRPDQRDVQ